MCFVKCCGQKRTKGLRLLSEVFGSPSVIAEPSPPPGDSSGQAVLPRGRRFLFDAVLVAVEQIRAGSHTVPHQASSVVLAVRPCLLCPLGLRLRCFFKFGEFRC